MSLKALLVTTWNIPCGISEHSAYLKASVEAADLGIEITPSPIALDPSIWSLNTIPGGPHIIHLNYHRALHSRWTAEMTKTVKISSGLPLVITFHDTYGENPPDQLTTD